MIGWIYKHAHLGVGKVIAEDRGAVRIRYVEGGAEFTLGRSAFVDGLLVRTPLPPGMRCLAEQGECTVATFVGGNGDREPFQYNVQYPDGTASVINEVDLVPLPGEVVTDPLQQLAGADPHPYDLFSAREWLVRSHARVVRDAGGFRALLSSRIDLLPHQAYVAGVVTGDWRRRYILADEVGLGKTIEAGLVIHDLLLQKPDARILVICPGELTQQWLCELFSKFGGHIFQLLDLHAPESIRSSPLRKAIVSTTLAGFRLSDVLERVQWDMVVVDEVHHLLPAPPLYALVERLSRIAPALLLLSAIPAQRREDEFLRLLRLLEPERYDTADPEDEAGRFRVLHEVQKAVGLRIRRLSARAEELRAGEVSREDVLRVASRLLEIPTLASDGWLRSMIEGLDAHEGDLTEATGEVVGYVADHYRINRRILRNRRQHLVARGEIASIERRFVPQPYDPGQLEREATGAVLDLLRGARDAGLPPGVLGSLSHLLLQSLVFPTAAHELLEALQRAAPSRADGEDAAYAAAGSLAGYAEWPAYRRLLCGLARPFVADDALAHALERVRAWRDSPRGFARRDRWIELLRGWGAEEPRPKLLLFAGFPGVCAELGRALAEELGPEAVREFRHDLRREEKEANVRAFATAPAVWVLVSDETGGEGRNFQFVDEIVHFDTPWSVAKVEQRIGRLDRIGRDAVRPDAVSNVLVAEGSPEAGLVHCYAEGVAVYQASISGLEFALRAIERDLLAAALDGGYEAMVELAPAVREVLEQERARDDDEALMDEASFNRAAAERLQRVAHSAQAEDDLEHSFVRYLQAVSSRRAVRSEDDRRHPKGVWTLQPEEFRHGVLPRAETGQEEIFRKARGTFRRGIAQARPDLEFFSAGHPLFDAMVRSLGQSVVGRTYAISCTLPDRPSWIGFELVFRAEPGWDAVAGRAGLANRAAMPFTAPPLHLFFRGDGTFEDDGDALRRMRLGLRMPDRERTWNDVPGPRLLPALRERVGSDWQAALLAMHEAARERAREHFAGRLEQALADEDGRVAESLRQIRLRGAPDDQGEVEALEALRAALGGWTVTLDAVGFLAVNPRRA